MWNIFFVKFSDACLGPFRRLNSVWECFWPSCLRVSTPSSTGRYIDRSCHSVNSPTPRLAIELRWFLVFRRIISFSYFLYRCGKFFFEYLIIEHCPLIKSKWIVHFGSSSLVVNTTLFRNDLVTWFVIILSLFSTSLRIYLSFGLTNTFICFVNRNESKFWESISTGWLSLLWWYHRLIRNR